MAGRMVFMFPKQLGFFLGRSHVSLEGFHDSQGGFYISQDGFHVSWEGLHDSKIICHALVSCAMHASMLECGVSSISAPASCHQQVRGKKSRQSKQSSDEQLILLLILHCKKSVWPRSYLSDSYLSHNDHLYIHHHLRSNHIQLQNFIHKMFNNHHYKKYHLAGNFGIILQVLVDAMPLGSEINSACFHYGLICVFCCN